MPTLNETVVDLVGQRFSRLIVIGKADPDTKGNHYWNCLCDCGTEKVVRGSNLRHESVRSCGCISMELRAELKDASEKRKRLLREEARRKKELRRPNLVGQKFGRLTVVKEVPTHVKNKRKWRCVCDCGEVRENFTQALRHGVVFSCGCLKKENLTKHGGTVSGNRMPEYQVWQDLLQRINNPMSQSYKDYGGRGISVTERWNSFENFIADMGRRPSDKHSIDRIDNSLSLGYTPENCRWATKSEQNRNKRNNRILTYKGESKCIMAWSEQIGCSWHALEGRLRRGYTVDEALETPLLMVGRRVTNLKKQRTNASIP